MHAIRECGQVWDLCARGADRLGCEEGREEEGFLGVGILSVRWVKGECLFVPGGGLGILDRGTAAAIIAALESFYEI
jgi:hypothetical protein